MARFVIDTGNMEMSRDDQMALQTELQQVAMKHIAQMGFDRPFAVKFPREWWGIILHPDLDRIPGLEKELGSRLNF